MHYYEYIKFPAHPLLLFHYGASTAGVIMRM